MYKEVLNKCTDEDYIKYKDELLELKQYYEQASAYETYKNGSDYVTPNVSYIKEAKK